MIIEIKEVYVLDDTESEFDGTNPDIFKKHNSDQRQNISWSM